MSVFKDLLPELCLLMQEAGHVVMDVARSREINVSVKSDETVVCVADFLSHETLVKGLRQLTPNLPILSEEGEVPDFMERSRWESYWLIDPLDATRTFIHDHERHKYQKNGEYSINVALIHQQRAILGLIYAPFEDKGYVGGAEFGAYYWLGSEKPTLTPIATRTPFVVPKTLIGHYMRDKETLNTLLQRVNVTEPVRMSSALKFCRLAEGHADLYLRLESLFDWDVAAGQAILEGAGGYVFNFSGDKPLYNQRADHRTEPFIALGGLEQNLFLRLTINQPDAV